MVSECLYIDKIQPPALTGHGAPFRLGEGRRSTSSSLSKSLDSDDPFC